MAVSLNKKAISTMGVMINRVSQEHSDRKEILTSANLAHLGSERNFLSMLHGMTCYQNWGESPHAFKRGRNSSSMSEIIGRLGCNR